MYCVYSVYLTWKLKSLLWYRSVAILQSMYYGTLQRGIDYRCIVERRCVHTLPKGAFLLVDASRNRPALILLILYRREICNFV